MNAGGKLHNSPKQLLPEIKSRQTLKRDPCEYVCSAFLSME